MERVVQQVDFQFHERPKLLRVCAYARVSLGKDTMLHSLSAQISYYSNMIQNHQGWLYCGVFSDEAVTGTKQDREGFFKMLEECRKGNIDLVLVKSISRFARNTVTLLQTTRELKSLGVDVFFEEQNIHTLSSDGELMMTILASYAQEESLSASENQKWRIRKAFENGELMNLRFLYGYEITAEGISVNREEAAVVKSIFERFNAGKSMSAISRDLNKKGCTGIHGGKWTQTRIRRILANEKYIGDAMLQKWYRNNHIEKKKVSNQGELPKYYAEGTHEPIIPKEVFEEAKLRLELLAKQSSEPQKKPYTLFSRLVVCGRCGSFYKRIVSRGKFYRQCRKYLSEGRAACCAKRIPEEILETLTCEVLGIQNPDLATVRAQIAQIRVEENNTLMFCMRDGTKIIKHWKNRSRANSWTPEMKEKARQRALLGRENANKTMSGRRDSV